MDKQTRSIVWGLVVILAVAGIASGARKGRLVGRVVDENDKPIEGVTVTATSDQVNGFNEVEVTDKKGVFKIDFDEVNVVYKYRFEKAGYQTMVTQQTWRKDGTARHDFTMFPGQSAAVEDGVVVSTSRPAIQAFHAGVASFEEEMYADSVARFQEAIEHDPELGAAWGALSVAQLQMKKYAEAAQAAEKAIELGSTTVLVYQTRWEAYRNLGDEAKTAEAREDLEKAGRLAEEAKRIYNEALALRKAGDYDGAYELFKDAVEADPNLELAILGVATTALKTERHAEAAEAAQKLLEDNPSHEQALRIRYNAALQLGDEEMIVDALAELVVVEPEMVRQSLWRLALSAYDANDMERAKTRFEKVLEVDPGNAQCHYFLGLIYVNEEANQQAIKHLQRFVELAPDDPEAATATDLVAYLGGS